MKQIRKAILTRVDPKFYDKIIGMAKEDDRNISNYVKIILKKYVREQQQK